MISLLPLLTNSALLGHQEQYWQISVQNMYFSEYTMNFPAYHQNDVSIELINCDQSTNNGNTVRDRDGEMKRQNVSIDKLCNSF